MVDPAASSSKRRTLSRRAWCGMVAAAVPGALGAAPAAKPKIGCLSWCFHPLQPRQDPQPAIDTIGKLGFDGVDLILSAREDIEGYWTDTRIDEIRAQLDKYKMTVAQFVLFQPVVEGLTSLDRSERQRNLDYFEAGCRIGKSLGAPVIDIVAPWARELHGPTSYLPRYYELAEPKPGEKFHIDIEKGFAWEPVWRNFVEVVRECLQRVKAHGMKFSIEHHTHCLVPDAASFLLLWNEIRDPALGYNLDTGWTMSQREYPPVAIYKVNERLMNVHVRDIDGLFRKFVHFGEGVMDFPAIASAIQRVGYTGFLSLEQDKHPGDMVATCRRYLETMRGLLG